jgi:hypothetical protein
VCSTTTFLRDPGSAVQFPAGVDFPTQVQPLVIAAILANPAAAIELAAVDQVELQYDTFAELVQTLVTSFTFSTAWWSTGDVYDAVNGMPFYDNTEVRYTGSADDAALNLGVQRYAAHPSARNEISRWYTPTGQLNMPVLNLHTRRDPVVPVMVQSQFAVLKAPGRRTCCCSEFGPVRSLALTLPEEIAAINDPRHG